MSGIPVGALRQLRPLRQPQIAVTSDHPPGHGQLFDVGHAIHPDGLATKELGQPERQVSGGRAGRNHDRRTLPQKEEKERSGQANKPQLVPTGRVRDDMKPMCSNFGSIQPTHGRENEFVAIERVSEPLELDPVAPSGTDGQYSHGRNPSGRVSGSGI